MQSTGVKDRIGTLVYEHDIVFNSDTDKYQYVFWNYDKAAWYCRYIREARTVPLWESLANGNYVVGNIYENADILPSEYFANVDGYRLASHECKTKENCLESDWWFDYDDLKFKRYVMSEDDLGNPMPKFESIDGEKMANPYPYE